MSDIYPYAIAAYIGGMLGFLVAILWLGLKLREARLAGDALFLILTEVLPKGGDFEQAMDEVAELRLNSNGRPFQDPQHRRVKRPKKSLPTVG